MAAGGSSDDSSLSGKFTNTEIEAAIKLQAFLRGVTSRIRVAGMLGSVIDDMLDGNAPPDSGDEDSYDGSASKSDDDNMSLASDDFDADELQEYLQGKYDKEDQSGAGGDDRIIRPSMRKESWIVHSPSQERTKLGSWRSNMKDMTKNVRGNVKERAKMINTTKNLSLDDRNANSMSDINYHSTPPSNPKAKVKKIGATMTKLLSPKRTSDASSGGNKLKLPIPNPKRKSDLPSPTSRLKVPLPSSVRRNSSALMDKVSDYTASVSPKVERKKKTSQAPRRKSDAIMEKVTVFKDFGEKMKTAKDALSKKPAMKKKENFNIDTHSTPKPRELRKSIEAGLFSQNLELPKIQPLDETEVEGIQAKIAQLGFDKTPEDPAADLVAKSDRVVDFAAHQYLLHDSATKIQAVARGYLYRKRDQEAMARVQRWLHQNQDIQKALTGDPEEVSEEERAKAVEAFAQTIERLVPPELTRGASRAAGIGASFVVESLSERESVRRESGISHPFKPTSFSTLKNAFDTPVQEEEVEETTGHESAGKKSSIRNRQQQMNEAATIIQACTRGHLVRKSNFGSAVSALNWLKEYKLMAKLEEAKKGIPHDQSKLDGALDAINKVQSMLHGSATKIQAITRGYIVRKFDMKTMMNVMDWVRACKLEIEEEQAPKTEQLEDTWIFLENANRWIRETEKRKSASLGEPCSEDVVEEELDVNELLSTWEYVKRDISTEASKESKEDPSGEELERLKQWLTESDYPYVSSSDEDMQELWSFLGSQNVNVDAFRDEDWDETKSSGCSIEYIDEDLSRFYGKLPSINALIEFWSFSRKHDIETLAAARQEETDVVKDSQQSEQEQKQTETELVPAVPEAEAAPVPQAEVKTQAEMAPVKVETKPSEAETEETKTVADVTSDSEDSIEPLPKPVKKVKRRTATNIDGMMSSLKWLKKKGLDLNRIKGGTSVGKAKSGGADVAKSGTLAKLGLGSRKSKIPDAGPKMSSALDWLEKKGLDISETVSKQLAEDPTPDEMSEVVKRMSNNKNTQNIKVPTAEEMEQTMKWWKIQQSAKDLKKKQKKKKKKKGKNGKTEKQNEEEEDDIAPPALASTDSMQYALNFLQKTGKSNGATRPSSGLEKTVELMQKQVDKKRESEISSAPETNPSPQKEKQLSESDIYEADALEWLNTGDEAIKGAAYFAKLDKTLPGKDSHTNEHRAKEIAKAMKWVDKQGFLAEQTEPAEKTDATSGGEESITDSDEDAPPKPLKPPKAVKKKVDAKAKKIKKSDTSKSSKSKSSKKKESKSRSPSRSRSRSPDDLESRSRSTSKSKTAKKKASKSRSTSRSRSSSPTRSRSASPGPVVKKKKKVKDGKSSKKADLPSVKSMLSPRKKKKTLMRMKTGEQDPERDYELAVAWLTSRDENMEDAKYFQKLDNMVPQNPDHSLEERAAELVKALNWVRKTSEKNRSKESDSASPKPSKPKTTAKLKSPKTPKRKVKLKKDDEDEKTDRAVLNLKDLVKAQKTRKADSDGGPKKSESSPEQDYQNALHFIRIKEEGGDITECEDCNYFKKLDNMLPKKGTSEERAREMVKMLGWLRKKGKA